MSFKNLDDVFEATSSQRGNMHTHDRTMLSQLGFTDPDKKNPEHDRVCRYLATTSVAARLISAFTITTRPGPGDAFEDDVLLDGQFQGVRATYSTMLEPSVSATTEFHLTKGVGQYQTTVGFLDVKFDFIRRFQFVVTHKFKNCKWVVDDSGKSFVYETPSRSLFAEVKVAPVGVGDVLRQLNLYRTYLFSEDQIAKRKVFGVLVAPWDVTTAESEELAKSGYAFVKLGDDYRNWAEADQKTVAKPHLEL